MDNVHMDVDALDVFYTSNFACLCQILVHLLME